MNFKDDSYTVVRCALSQVAMTMFGLMLAFATLSNTTLLLLSSLLAILLYLVILYYTFWEIGGKDRIKEDAGRRNPTPWKPVQIAACANALNFLLAVLMLVSEPFSDTNEIAGNIYFISNMLARGLEAMYLGFINVCFSNTTLIFLLIPLPAIFTAWFAYFLGHRNFRIAGLLGIKPNTKDETR